MTVTVYRRGFVPHPDRRRRWVGSLFTGVIVTGYFSISPFGQTSSAGTEATFRISPTGASGSSPTSGDYDSPELTGQ